MEPKMTEPDIIEPLIFTVAIQPNPSRATIDITPIPNGPLEELEWNNLLYSMQEVFSVCSVVWNGIPSE